MESCNEDIWTVDCWFGGVESLQLPFRVRMLQSDPLTNITAEKPDLKVTSRRAITACRAASSPVRQDLKMERRPVSRCLLSVSSLLMQEMKNERYLPLCWSVGWFFLLQRNDSLNDLSVPPAIAKLSCSAAALKRDSRNVPSYSPNCCFTSEQQI